MTQTISKLAKSYRKHIFWILSFWIFLFMPACKNQTTQQQTAEEKIISDSIDIEKKRKEEELKKPIDPSTITLTKSLEYDKHTLQDEYPYKDTTRSFQWDKIKENIAYIVSFQRVPHEYGVLQNRRNKNKEAPLVEEWTRNAYKRVQDKNGTERWQSIPLYPVGQIETPELYGRDGSLVSILSSDTIPMVKVNGISFDGEWEIPKRYLKPLGDSLSFERIVFIDVKNQNICTVEHVSDTEWKILSMNPATTGVHKPPYSMETPLGIFVIQQKKSKMLYVKDGTQIIKGYAPYASRFTNGAYVHGFPTQDVNASIIEYSSTLGTTPRSHMCVRTASSHAKFVYDWAKVFESLVVVID